MIPMSKHFLGGLRRRPKSFTFKPLHQNEENIRKPSVLLLEAPALSSVLLLEVEMVGIMLESCWNHFLIFLSLQKLQKQGWDFSFLFLCPQNTVCAKID
jgi:hypothetical protein